MTGKEAYEFLKGMTEDERNGVVVVWLDDEQVANNLAHDDDGLKARWFDGLSGSEKGRMLERGLYNASGDISAVFDSFLDGYAENLEKAIDEEMALKNQ